MSEMKEMKELVAVTLGVAREAAALLMSGYRTTIAVEHKGRVDLVTKFDRESEELIRGRLSPIHPVIGEEAGGEATEGRPVFIVDPLDGTTNFVHGHPFFCVSIGLVENGIPVMGVIVAPALGVEWVGVVGSREATRSGGPCRPSSTSHFGESLLATGFPYDRSVSGENNFDAFVAIKQRCQAVRRCGSAALDLCLVADGTYEGYWERKLNAWDIAAGTAIVLAAGGRVTDFDGDAGFMKSGHVVATNGHIHDKLLQELAEVSARPPRY